MSERYWIHRVADSLLERMSVRASRQTLLLADHAADRGDTTGLDRLGVALDLLELHDTRGFRHVLRRLRAVHLVRLDVYAALYRHGSRTCYLDRALIFKRSPAETAATLVHEATHARLMDCGIGYDEHIRSRVEQACDREQLRTLSRLGASPAVVEQVRQRLGRQAATDQELLAREEDIMAANGIPRPLIRALARLRELFDGRVTKG